MPTSRHKNGTCTGTTKAGTPCNAPSGPSGLCFFHEYPDKAAELGRQGGLKNRCRADDDFEMPPLNTAEDVRAMLSKLAADLRARRVEPRVATSLGQLANALLKAIEVADLEARLKRLEGKLGPEETS
jgi:hypothetical protein